MSSFLILPVQRIARYKLLVDAVNKILPETEYDVLEQGYSLSKRLENVTNPLAVLFLLVLI